MRSHRAHVTNHHPNQLFHHLGLPHPSTSPRKEKDTDDAIVFVEPPSGVLVSLRDMLFRQKAEEKDVDGGASAAKAEAEGDVTAAQTNENTDISDNGGKTVNNHDKTAPLVVDDSREPQHQQQEPLLSPPDNCRNALVLGRKMIHHQRNSEQPPGLCCYTGYSDHSMVNEERSKRAMMVLTRMDELDTLAAVYANQMAAKNELFYVSPQQLVWPKMLPRPSRRLGVNVRKGKCSSGSSSIQEMHAKMMHRRSQKHNILDKSFTQFGMAIAQSSDGTYYLCQIFGG